MTTTTHEDAVRAAVKAAGARLTDVDKPMVELALALARQIDDAGEAGPPTRTAASYLTALRTLRLVTGAGAPKASRKSALANLSREAHRDE